MLNSFFAGLQQPLSFPETKNAYDFNTSLLYLDGDLPSFDSEEVALHEISHWFQHHGTAIGCFTTLLRDIRDGIALRGLRACEPRRLASMFRDRLNGKPIFELDADRHLPVFSDDWRATPQGAKTQEAWYSYFLADVAMSRYSRIFEMVQHPAAAIATAAFAVQEIARANNWVNLPALDHSQLAGLTRAAIQDFSTVYLERDGAREPLDTFDLMETAAFLVEARLILERYTPRYPLDPSPGTWAVADASAVVQAEKDLDETIALARRAGERVERLPNLDAARMWAAFGRFGTSADPYTVALHIAAERLGESLGMLQLFHPSTKSTAVSVPFVVRYLDSLAAAIEVALNPPLPPRHSLDPLSLSWAQIYPPVRFAACVDAIKKIGPLDVHDSDRRKDYEQYQIELAEKAGIIFVIDPTFPDGMINRQKRLTFENAINGKGPMLSSARYVDYALSFQESFRVMQKDADFGRVSDLMRSIRLPLIGEEIAHRFPTRLSPPLVYLTCHNATLMRPNRHWAKGAAESFLVESIMSTLPYELFVGSGLPDLSAFHIPSEDRDVVLSVARERVEAYCGQAPW